MSAELCGKVKYASPQEARAALVQVRERKGRGHAHERRFYRCQRCGSYHLTKMSDRNDRGSTNWRNVP